MRQWFVGLLVAAVCGLGCDCVQGADFAAHELSFGEGIPHIRWLTLAPDGGRIVISDSDLVRTYAFDGAPLERLFERTLPASMARAVAVGVTGDFYLLVLPATAQYSDAPGVQRWSADGAGLGGVLAAGDQPGQFNSPTDIALGLDGCVFVADCGNQRIQKFSPDLEFLAEFRIPESLSGRGFTGPQAIGVDGSGSVWAVYVAPSYCGPAYPFEVVVWSPDGAPVSSFACTVEIAHESHAWGDVVLDIGIDSLQQLRVLSATDWNSRSLLTYDTSGNQIAQFPVGGFVRGASFTSDGTAVAYGSSEGVEVISPTGLLVHRWGSVEWASQNDLPDAPKSVSLDSLGRICVSGGNTGLLPDAPCYGYFHRYTSEGVLDEIAPLDPAPHCSNYWYSALAPDDSPVFAWDQVCTDRSGNRYYLLDSLQGRVRKTDPEGATIAEWDLGPSVTAVAVGLDGLFYDVRGQVEVRDLDGNLIAEWGGSRYAGAIAVFRDGSVLLGGDGLSLYSSTGQWMSTVAYAGVERMLVTAIAVDDSGMIALADEWASRVHLFRLIATLFPDVPWGFWAIREINALAEANIVQGYPDGLYRPGLTITRDQMAVYISRALAGGEEHVPPGPAQATFPDVPTDYWAYDHIEYTVANNVVQGYEDGNYHPDWEVTRGQMAVFVARSVVTPTGEAGLLAYEPPEVASFPDVPTTYWCYKHVEYCKQSGIVAGYPDGTYRPTQYVTRDQMAVYIQRAFQLPL
jgi:hypothetical protein